MRQRILSPTNGAKPLAGTTVSDDKIDLESPMQKALTQSAGSYQPVFRGAPLTRESGDPEASLKNLRHLLAAGLKISSFEAGACGILVTFQSGEKYLATGLSLGTDEKRTTYLARIASESGLGEYELWKLHLGMHLPSFHGLIEVPPPPRNKKLSVFEG